MRYNLLFILLVSVSLLSACGTTRDTVVHYSASTQPRMVLGHVEQPNCWWSCQISVVVSDSEGKNLGGAVQLRNTTADSHNSSLGVGVPTTPSIPRPVSPYGDR